MSSLQLPAALQQADSGQLTRSPVDWSGTAAICGCVLGLLQYCFPLTCLAPLYLDRSLLSSSGLIWAAISHLDVPSEPGLGIQRPVLRQLGCLSCSDTEVETLAQLILCLPPQFLLQFRYFKLLWPRFVFNYYLTV